MSIEIVKKTKAPAKPKTTAKTKAGETESAVKTALKTAAKSAVKAAPKAKAAALVAAPSHQEIAQLAERYWVERGWQDGYAEQDWLRAEQELRGVAS